MASRLNGMDLSEDPHYCRSAPRTGPVFTGLRPWPAVGWAGRANAVLARIRVPENRPLRHGQPLRDRAVLSPRACETVPARTPRRGAARAQATRIAASDLTTATSALPQFAASAPPITFQMLGGDGPGEAKAASRQQILRPLASPTHVGADTIEDPSRLTLAAAHGAPPRVLAGKVGARSHSSRIASDSQLPVWGAYPPTGRRARRPRGQRLGSPWCDPPAPAQILMRPLGSLAARIATRGRKHGATPPALRNFRQACGVLHPLRALIAIAFLVAPAASQTLPGPPTGLTATANGPNQIDLAWTAPQGGGGGVILGYRIEVSLNPSTHPWINLVANTGSRATTYSDPVIPGTTRYFRVSAINSAGTGTASNVASATTPPAAPTGLTATSVGRSQIDLSWTAPADNRANPIIGYRVEVSPNGSGNWSERTARTAGTDTTHSHAGLAPSTIRYYRVSAVNSGGRGPPSNVATAITHLPAAVEVPSGWDLIPSGLSAGSSFRLLFRPDSKRNASSAEIVAYNKFIQRNISSGLSDIRPYTAHFRVVGSTASVDARDHTATTYTSSDKGVPIYWLKGGKIADDYEDFYDGSWDAENNWHDEFGRGRPSNDLEFICTGSGNDGTESIVSGTSRGLGEPLITVGRLASPNGDPLSSGVRIDRFTPCSYYGLSPVFTVVSPNQPVDIPSDWELIPSGLIVGDSFRLLFVSSNTRSATATGIGTYNSFVQQSAANGHEAIQPFTERFTAVASTADTDARDNTDTAGSGVPIYWLAGNKVADDYADFYDGAWDDESNPTNERGAAASATAGVWTGSGDDGTEALDGSTSRALGTSSVATGVLNSSMTGNNPLHSNDPADAATLRPLYALSPVFRITATVPHDSGLRPSELGAGARFRLLFLSSTKRDGLSANIDDYNTFIQNSAANGHSDLQIVSTGFKAVGSTGDTDARDNTETTYTSSDKGVPIYWVNGSKVANDYEDFYDGSWDDEANAKNEFGNDGPDTRQSSNYPFTGSLHDGTKAGVPSVPSAHRHLGGDSGQVRVGRPNTAGADFGPIGSITTANDFDERPMYGISSILTVGKDASVLLRATLVVGVSGNIEGFRTAGPAVGSLSHRTFEYYGTEYQIAWLNDDTNSPNPLALGTTSALSERALRDLTVVLDDKEFHLRDSEPQSNIRERKWNNSGLDWVNNQNVNVLIKFVDGPPLLTSERSVDRAGTTLTLWFDENLETATAKVPATSDFTVTANGSAVSVTSVSVGTGGNHKVLGLSLGATVPMGATVTVSYEDPTSGDDAAALQDTGGSDVASFSNVAVDNRSNVDLTAPVLGATGHRVLASGLSIHLSFGEDLEDDAALLPPASAFTVAADGTAVPVTSVSVGFDGSDAVLVLDLQTSIKVDQTVTVSYADPSAGNDTNALQDAAGNDVPSFSGIAVQNDSTQPARVPGAPTNLTATGDGKDQIDLVWTAPEGTGVGVISGYRIEVSIDPSVHPWFDLVANTGSNATTHSHTVVAGTTRYYRVSAINSLGTGPPSNVASATTRSTDPPPAPTGLTATGVGESQIDLAWTASAGNGTNPVIGYRVEVSPNGTSNWSERTANTASTATTYSHAGLGPSTTRHYRVSAVDSQGPGPPSNVAGATTLLPSALEVPSGWDLIPSGFSVGDSFRILFRPDSKRNPSSTDIDDYNKFIQRNISVGLSDIQPYSVHFRVVGSTASVDARDNTATTYTSSDKGVPIYWLKGGKVADDYEDFYDGSWDTENNWYDELGRGRPSNSRERICTGSANDGTERIVSDTSRGLGESMVSVGLLAASNAAPLTSNAAHNRSTSCSYYGLSPVFTVVSANRPIDIPSGWELIPSGLGIGDSFRLLFVSSTTRNATATGVGTYNSFVRQSAANGHEAIQPFTERFTAVGSTADTDARDNTDTTGSGVPIYWLAGNKVADDYAEFYDGVWDDESNPTNESGAAASVTAGVWTGSGDDGTEALDGSTSRALGTSSVATGVLNSSMTGNNPLHSNDPADAATLLPFYALSPIFRISATVSHDWSLIPSGLGTGDSFHLLFISSTRRPLSSTSIDTYNSFVRNRATNGHSDLRIVSGGFKAVASTEDTDARDNTETTYASSDKGLPIYWVNGSKVADDYEDFYDGSWDDEANPKDENGEPAPSITDANNYPATGSNHDGTKSVSGSNSLALGNSDGRGLVTVGRPNVSNAGPLSSGNTAGRTNQRPLYGLSSVLTVGKDASVLLRATLVVGISNNLEGFRTSPSIGSLSHRTFEYYGTEYLIVWLNDDTNSPNPLALGTTSALSERALRDLTVVLDDKEFHLRDSEPQSNIRERKWNNSGLNWVNKQNVNVLIKFVDGAPLLTSGHSVDQAGTTLTLWFDENLETATAKAPATSDFTVTANGSAVSVTSVNVGVGGRHQALGLSLGATVPMGATVTVSYDDPTSGDDAAALQDTGGSDVASFSDIAVNNRSNVDLTAPILATTGHSVLASGLSIHLSFAEDLEDDAGLLPPASAFTVAADGIVVPVTAVSVGFNDSNAVLVLGLQTSIKAGQIVSVSYADPSAGNDASALQDEAGNDVPSFIGISVRNDSEEPATVPGAPTGLTATASSTDQIDLAWTAPADTGGRAISGYKIETSPDGSTSWSDLVSDTDSNAATYADTGLDADTTRHYRVSAINSVGTGAVSNTDSATTAVPTVTASFGAAMYAATEGGAAAEVTVTLSVAPEREVAIPISATNQSSTVDADYSGVPSTLTFGASDTSKSFAVQAVDDSAIESEESVQLGFGMPLPPGISAGTQSTAIVNLVDNDGTAVTVSFGASSYDANEDGTAASVLVQLSQAAEREVVIPITVTALGGASDSDFSGVPSTLTFGASDTSKTFTVTADDDADDDDGESVQLGFGTLPAGVSAGTLATATVNLVDDDNPAVTVSFGGATFTATEGGSDAMVTVQLDKEPEREVVISITATSQGGADDDDYSGVPTTVTFGASDTSKTFSVTAVDDRADDDDESVRLGFDTPLPAGVSAGTQASATVNLVDNDEGTVPGRVRDLAASPGDRRVTLSWRPPADDGGSPITRYTYRYRAPATSFAYSGEIGPEETSVVVEPLTSDQEYVFQVAAHNAVGRGLHTEVRATVAPGAGGICDRSDGVQRAILVRLPGVPSCEEVTASHLAGITGMLDVSGQGLRELVRYDFEGLERVEGLSLVDNLLHAFPAGVFRPLVRLRELNLAWNWLPPGSIPYDELEALPRLLKVIILGTESNRPGATIMPTALTLRPGASGLYAVRLDSDPAEGGDGVRVHVQSDSQAVTVSPASLHFTWSNWWKRQEVRVRASSSEGTAVLSHEIEGFEHWLPSDIREPPNVTVRVDGSLPSSFRGDRPAPAALWSVARSAQRLPAEALAAAAADADWTPAQLVLWTDRLGYSRGDPLSVYLSRDPRGDRRGYVTVFYRENVRTGKREYFAPRTGSMEVGPVAVDEWGAPTGRMRARAVAAGRQALEWSGPAPEAGLWKFVAELREPGLGQLVKRAQARVVVTERVPRVLGEGGKPEEIEGESHWGRETIYRLRGPVRVRAGGTLVIEAGTLLEARGADARIEVEPGGRLFARGREDAPVVLTCEGRLGEREPGCWGGLEVRGAPPGGAEPSGALTFVRVEFAGGGAGRPAAVLLEGLDTSFAVERLQVHASAGDGIELRGGSAGCYYCVASDSGGTGLVWGGGWSGIAQHVYVQQGAGGLAAAGDSGLLAEVRSEPVLANATLAGGHWRGVSGGREVGLLLRSNAALTVRNAVITGFRGGGVEIVGPVLATLLAGAGPVEGLLLHSNGHDAGVLPPRINAVEADPRPRNLRREGNPDPRPRPGSAALAAGLAAAETHPRAILDGGHIGAFGDRNWLESWTFFGPEADYARGHPQRPPVRKTAPEL